MYRLICDLPCLPYLDIWDKSNLEQAFIYVLFLDWKYNLCLLCSQRVDLLPHNPSVLTILRMKPLKTIWEKEKMMVTSIFSFSLIVFWPSQYINFNILVSSICHSVNAFKQGYSKVLLLGKELNPLYSIDTHFNASTTNSFWIHCGKRRNCS